MNPARGGTSGGARLLLATLVLAWAASWPVVKVGVGALPPLWFAFARYALAAACLFPLVAWRGECRLPRRADWPLVAVSGLLQMAAYSALTGLALTVLPPGRASVLAFSTPIWVVPLAAWWLDEPMPARTIAGVAAGVAGMAAVAAPALQASATQPPGAYAMLAAAAAAWAVTIVFVRAHRFVASPLALAPWQMLLAAAVLLPMALVLEGVPPRAGPRGLAALAYVGPVATAFAYWAMVVVARRLPAATVATALLATPVLGIVLSAWTLGEPIGPELVAGVALVGAGIRLAAPAARR